MTEPQLKPDRPDLSNRLYLGDGAYVGTTPFGEVELWTTNGIKVTNRVVLEQPVLHSFIEWVRQLGLGFEV